MLAAGALLVALLIAVPGFLPEARPGFASLRTSSTTEKSTNRPADHADLGAATLDVLEDDWLTDDSSLPLGSDADSADANAAIDCLIQPSKIIEIGSQVIGLVEAIHVQPGESVEAGQTVVELESALEYAAVDLARKRTELEGSLQAREAQLALTRRRQARGSELFQKSALSEDTREELDTQAKIAALELLQAKENRQLAALELRQAEALLERRRLRSPISGVVTERLVDVGEVVDEEKTILEIAQVDPLRVEVLMPASRYGSVRKGMRASIEPEFPGDTTVVATVAIVDPVIDAASGTFSVRLDLPNSEGLIPGGLHCGVQFLEGE